MFGTASYIRKMRAPITIQFLSTLIQAMAGFFPPSYWMLGGAVQWIMYASGSFFTFGGNISIINIIVTLFINIHYP